MAEKIKVSVIIDKEVVKNLAFSLAKTPKEYNEVKEIIDGNDEFVRDNTNESDEEIKNANNCLFSKFALDMIFDNNKDLIMSKNAKETEEACEDADELIGKAKKLLEELASDKGDDNAPGDQGGTMKCVKLTKEQAKEFMEKFGSMFEED